MNFLLRAVNVLKQAKFYIELVTPMLEQIVNKDLNKDGKIG